MSVFTNPLPETWVREPLQSRYRVTKKPRALDLAGHPQIAFAPMEAVPLRGRHQIIFQHRAQEQIASGTYFERGDFLLSKITPSFENGKQGMAVGLPDNFGFASTEIIPLQAERHANNWFLFYYLLDPEVRSLLTDRMEGSTGRQRVPIHAVNTLQVPFPPLFEQEKIAAVLWKTQQGAELEEKLAATARELKTAAMRRLFSFGLSAEPQIETEVGTVPKSWKVVPLGQLAKIGNGSTPKKTIPAYWQKGSLPWLTSAKVYDEVIQKADQFVTQLAAKECHLPLVPADSLVVAITGQGKTLGHVARVAIDTFVSQHLAYITFSDKAISAEFMRQYLGTRYGYFRQVSQGYGSTKGALTCAFLKSCMVPVPNDPNEQTAIATALGTIDRKIAVHERRATALRELFASLLHRLMTGEVRVDKLDIDVSEVRA